ncbi:MAG: hypothetical protein RLZZ337_1416 [Bacteroidota bacterium]
MVISSCRIEEFTLDPNHKLEISADTVWFDTVFTKVNTSTPKSVNKQIIIRNPQNKSIKTSIQLASGATSHFRLNVDGESGHQFSDVEIFPNDSIFMFLEVHPDANNNSPDFNPLIIRDSILFETNGNEQKVNIIGWGQDAHYIFRDSIERDTTWANDKLPIVVYGYCYVKPGVTLTIEKGMNLHFAPSSWLFVEGRVDIKGDVDAPVLIQGDRLQPMWEERQGQWGGIWINYPSFGSTIEHAIIKNGTVGVYCDTISGNANQPNITIKKTMIRNMSFDGVAGRYSHIVMENSVSAECGRFTFLASFGGKYDVQNCTFYSGTRGGGRNGPTFGFLNVNRNEFNQILGTYPIQFYFVNNIVHGINAEGEIGRDLDETKIGSGSVVDYNLLRSNDAFYFGNGSNNIAIPNFQAFQFLDLDTYNFDLDTLSPAKDKGLLRSPILTDDFLNRSRIGNPDIGAFESQF